MEMYFSELKDAIQRQEERIQDFKSKMSEESRLLEVGLRRSARPNWPS